MTFPHPRGGRPTPLGEQVVNMGPTVSVFFEEGLSFKGALYYQTLTDSKKLVRNDDATISGQNDDVKCDTLDITVPILTSPDKMIYV
ncbi:hypothetical protein F2P81_023804 [Scophthalmus maximus]|uniref:Uncharacterized protein n=1 Tax=Scophthalmus maximus TaxID=52904 RepID=A0A6A4RXI5_SCOMX|nr:hypothetical protein F2P81_023804 [Scophthalmus maximus]